MLKNFLFSIVFFSMTFVACGNKESKINNEIFFTNMIDNNKSKDILYDTITLGGGCFWCVEAQLLLLQGVVKVVSGYAGGNTLNPTYKEICTGSTGHAEVIQVTFDKSIISLDEILAAFWQSHDPTQLNRQGNDIGTQYRSIILYKDEEQKELATYYKNKFNTEKVYDKEVVTEIAPLMKFYPAEDYHQNYYNNNTSQGYCQYVIAPKVEKFKKVFKDKLITK